LTVRTSARIAAVIAAALVFASCSDHALRPGPNDGSTLNFTSKATIVVDDNGITPEDTKGQVGEAITVTNRGTKDHGLTSDAIETGTLHPGESTTVFLTQAGTIELRDRGDLSHTARIDVADPANS
jgi:hypothetical protein